MRTPLSPFLAPKFVPIFGSQKKKHDFDIDFGFGCLPGPVLVPFGVTFRSRRPPKNDIDSESDSEVHFGSPGAPSELKKCGFTKRKTNVFEDRPFAAGETLRGRF